jgi:hypothetical protein
MVCTLCREIQSEMKRALAELFQRDSSGVSREQSLHALRATFASEGAIGRLADSFRASPAGSAYARWTEHRIATGHTAFFG